MLRQFLVGGGVSLITIAIHALVMTMVVQVARAMGAKQQSHSSLVLIAVMIPTISVLMAAHVIEVFVWALAYLIFDVAPRGGQSRIFCVRELRDTRLWRRGSGGTLATAWPSNRDERYVAVWMVDRSHFRGSQANVSAHPRYQMNVCHAPFSPFAVASGATRSALKSPEFGNIWEGL